MPIRIPRGWEIPERLVTPESLALGRRQALGLGAAIGAGVLGADASAQGVYAAPRNARFVPGRDITSERDATTYNNYYEFGTSKSIWQAAQRLPMRPWTVKIDGLVAKPVELDMDDLLRRLPVEERVYRLRCVEAWSMVVPWTGFTLASLLELAAPQAGAKFVRFETAEKKDVMPGLRQAWFPWPYVEACTVEEAKNDLSFMVVGAYGKALPPQNGGPIRIHQPWKYGFKGCKSITRISLVADRPKSFWEQVQAKEYGFWANVNPEVAHPRWSQASERVLGSGDRIPTQLFNGYGPFVADLYKGMEKEPIFF